MASGDTMQGRRIPDADGPPDWRKAEPGDYGKVRLSEDTTIWYICDPNGTLGSLRSHTIEEHDDGTITVSPSILDPSEGGWHGWLERGTWREA